MSSDHLSSAFNLLGQAIEPVEPVRLQSGQEPQLEIAWGSFHQGLGSSFGVLLSRSGVPRDFLPDGFFRDCWVQWPIPRRAVLAAALWHVAFLILPFPHFPATPRHFSAFENTTLTWSGPINDFPPLELKSAKPKPAPRTQPEKPPALEAADAFHPRQRIFTDSLHPTHPRQTLINSAAPLEPPKLLPSLPNVVQFQQMSAPARPRLQISEETLAKLRPREHRAATATVVPAPDLPVLEQKAGDISLALSLKGPARPKVELNAGVAPRLAPRAQTGDAGPAPELGAAHPNVANGGPATFIALSAAPAPPAPIAQPPQGNLAARVSLSPEGKPPGVPSSAGTEAASAAGKGPLDVSISGGLPPAKGVASDLGGPLKISAPSPHALINRPDPRLKMDDSPARTGPPNFASLPPGAQPEQIFGSRIIYKMFVNMPNLNSSMGSWILNFTELRLDSNGQRFASQDISGPVPLRKVDPKYPPTLINDRVEGEVILYAVIRRDGSVDSIQLVHGIDDQLDANAMLALSQWKFRPALKQGSPVDLEAIVHIPFHPPISQ